MRNSSIALCLGCAALLVGSLGLIAGSAFDLNRPAESAAATDTGAASPPSYLEMATVPPPPPASGWPSNTGTPAVAFYAEMIELLTPRTAVVVRREAAEPVTEGRGHGIDESGRDAVREAPPRDAARAVPTDAKQKSKATIARKKQPQQTEEQQREEVEVVVRDPFGNQLRTQQVEREAPRSDREAFRNDRETIRRDREAVEPRERAYAPGPLQLFDSIFRW